MQETVTECVNLTGIVLPGQQPHVGWAQPSLQPLADMATTAPQLGTGTQTSIVFVSGTFSHTNFLPMRFSFVVTATVTSITLSSVTCLQMRCGTLRISFVHTGTHTSCSWSTHLVSTRVVQHGVAQTEHDWTRGEEGWRQK